MNQQRQQAALGIEQQGLGQQQQALAALAGVIMPLLNLDPSAATGAMGMAGQGMMGAAQGGLGLAQLGMQQQQQNQAGLASFMQALGGGAFGGFNLFGGGGGRPMLNIPKQPDVNKPPSQSNIPGKLGTVGGQQAGTTNWWL